MTNEKIHKIFKEVPIEILNLVVNDERYKDSVTYDQFVEKVKKLKEYKKFIDYNKLNKEVK